MKNFRNLRGNVLVLAGLSAFVLFGIFGNATSAQMMRSSKPTPTPKKSATPKGMAPKQGATPKPKNTPPKPKATVTPKMPSRPVPVPTPKVTPTKPAEPQIIVAVTSARLRGEPTTSSETVQYLKIGSVYPVTEKRGEWSRVKAGENTGWVSNTVSQTFTNAKRDEIYQAIAAKYFKQQSMDFATASQLYDFLTVAEKQVTGNKLGDLSFKRLLALQAALKRIPIDKQDKDPYKSFIKGKEKEIVYSDPSAEYYVFSDLFWDLHEKYKGTLIGEDIAWQAALNQTPGECEGYINCYLFMMRGRQGEYLNFYPAGKYSKRALADLAGYLDPIVADSKEKSVYTGPSDISDRAEFNKLLTELRAIVSKSPYTEKSRALQQIKQLGEAYR